MANHLSTIGFNVRSDREFRSLIDATIPDSINFFVRHGAYLRWRGTGGEELWLQVSEDGQLLGLQPHFAGNATMRVRLDSRIERDSHPALDGAFYSWAFFDGHDGETVYPFVFDSPDSGRFDEIRFPSVAHVQLAAFAHEVEFHRSPEVFEARQGGESLKFATRSFIPSGLFSVDGGSTEPPGAMAILTGHVREAATRTNERTGERFHWALVDSLGGLFDVVIDPELLPDLPAPGGVIGGQFWLSGRILSIG